MTQPFVSIVIPAYNEELRLPESMAQAFAFLEQQTYTWEVLIVENGSQDRTLEVAQAFASRHPGFRVLQESQRGKGRAVQQGMLAARGSYRFMCDADFSMPVDEINRFFPPQLDVDIAIASREAPGSNRYGEPPYRHFVGRIFNTMIRLLALPGLHDTQCGFKCFKAEVAEDVFRCQTISGWSFDVEVLFIARKRGYTIRELPIPWYFNPESKVSVWRDSWQMALDLIHIRLQNWQGKYRAAR